MNWRNYRNQILQVSSQFEAYIFFNENIDQGNNEDKFVVITMGFVQFNIACISEHTGVKVRLKKRWLASEIYIHYFDTMMFPWWQDVYLVHEET